jgi:hypothetical protein
MRIKICQMVFFALLVSMPALAYSQDSPPKVNGEHDGRIIVYLTETEREAVFSEMRGFLESTESIVKAISEVNMQLAAESARKSGRAAGAHMPKTLHRKLPDSFKTLGSDTHRRFDELALDAEQLGDEGHSLSQLGAILGNCVSCHASFRIEVE